MMERRILPSIMLIITCILPDIAISSVGFSSAYSTFAECEKQVQCGSGIIDWYKIFSYRISGDALSYDSDGHFIDDSCPFYSREIELLDENRYSKCMNSVDPTNECCEPGMGKCKNDCMLESQTGQLVNIGNLLPEKDLFYSYGEKMEWRLADGKPFALIYRLRGYMNSKHCLDDTVERKPVSEYLIIQSLPGSRLTFTKSINARKIKNANIEARKIADSLYINQKR